MCKEEKPMEDFAKTTKNGKPYIRGRCKPCFNVYHREWYQKNKEVHKARVYANPNREYRRASKYGLTNEQFDELLKSNNGLCHICNVRKATAIDHCHESGKVRGHLCIQCNSGLGKFGDSIEGLMQAINYLERPDWR